MPDLRKDPIVDRWVIIAADRADRPNDFDTTPRRQSGRRCPFCEGNESETPGEIVACRRPGTKPDGTGWRVRVVPNKFPALKTDGQADPRNDGIYRAMPGVGAHEVIIESPEHRLSTSELSVEELVDVFRISRERMRELKQDPRLAYGLLFKNVGAAAGASLEHIHSQLIATPIVPVAVREELSGSLEYHTNRGICVYCDIIRQERDAAERLVLETPGFVAFCPFASRFPLETWIVPKTHTSHFETIQGGDVEDLAGVLRQVIGRLESTLDRPAYNTIMHTAPFDRRPLAHYHWHIEVIPRVTETAGFEWGTGFHINPVPPETAARRLREVEARLRATEDISSRETG